MESRKFAIIAALAVFGTLATIYHMGVPQSNIVAFQTYEETVYHDLFQQWKGSYAKVYASETEEAEKYKTFVSNYHQIIAFNALGNGATLGLNEFADLNGEEFSALIQCLSPESVASLHEFPVDSDFGSDYPSSVDWRTEGAVTDVKNQGQCGGCWAFGAAASLESYNFIKNNKTNLQSFSEQQLIDCVTNCSGCDGCDTLYNALIYTSENGIELMSDYPFTGATGKCNFNKADVVAQNQGYYNVQPQSVDALKTAIAQQPTMVGIQANQLVFQFYTGGVISALCGDKVDHAVTAVGYGSINGKDAFIIKNSWGPTWGAQGYVYISTDGTANGGNGVCGVLGMPCYPTQI
jgi:xylem cysteine proteinase